MNDVFLEGVIISLTPNEVKPNNTNLVTCQLMVPHRNRSGQLKQESYTILAWNKLATWVEKALRPGTRVFVKGYLTQRLQNGLTFSDVTASRIIIKQMPLREENPSNHSDN